MLDNRVKKSVNKCVNCAYACRYDNRNIECCLPSLDRSLVQAYIYGNSTTACSDYKDKHNSKILIKRKEEKND